MSADKLKQYIAMFGGVLGALLLFLRSIDFELHWFNEMSIEAFIGFLVALAPLVAVLYGVWKNQYIVSKKAREAEEVLKREGLK